MQQNFSLTFNITHWNLPFQCKTSLHAFQGHAILHTGGFFLNNVFFYLGQYYTHNNKRPCHHLYRGGGALNFKKKS